MDRRIFLAAALFGIPSVAAAKARYAGKAEMIGEAEIIAVVDVTRVTAVEKKGKHWTCKHAAEAKVETVLKGQLPEKVTLYGQENFICARADFKPGRQLVFLQRDGDLLRSSNWQVGVRPITGDTVEWLGEGNVFASTKAPLAATLAEIRKAIAATAR